MSRVVSWKSTALILLLACFSPALARAVVVPDDYSTIQAALDAGVDSIEVRDGVAPECIHVSHSVVIRAKQAKPYLYSWTASPHIRSLEIVATQGIGLEVHDVRFLGTVKTAHLEASHDWIIFEGCRFDSSFADAGQIFSQTSIRHCIFVGSVNLTGYVQFIGNTVLGGTLTVYADGVHDIRDNYIQGPADTGLDLRLQDSVGQVDMNTIRGTTDGIRVPGHAYLTHNDVRDCSGDGIVLLDLINAPCDSNLVSNCAGNGITVRPRGLLQIGVRMRGNIIRAAGKDGIHFEVATAAPFEYNQILDCGDDGLEAPYAEGVKGNVFGRNAGMGMRLAQMPVVLDGNTFLSNGGAGIAAGDGTYGQVDRNIFAFNRGPGVVNTGGHAQVSGCNDWFDNGGDPVGMSYGSNEWFVDPLFCDRFKGDGHLASNSALLTAADCGLIGALGIGCDAATTDVHPEPSPPIRSSAFPIPASGVVSFSIPLGNMSTELEVFDIAGARRWSTTTTPGARSVQWDRHQIDGTMAPPGVYFARLRRGEREIARTRIVLTK